MARPKKNGHYLNVCILEDIYKDLEEYSGETGVPKTVVVEKALSQYLEKVNPSKEVRKDD